MTLWFRNSKNNNRWNLGGFNGNNINDGCLITSTGGFGISNKIEKMQVGVDYIITAVKSNSVKIKFTLVFKNQKHLNNFIKFYQDSKDSLELNYDPTGKTRYSDQVTPAWYRNVLIADLNLSGQSDSDGWIKIPCTLEVLSDVWYKRIKIVQNKTKDEKAKSLTYPKFYTYYYGGKNRIAVKLDNPGMEIGCKIKVKNVSPDNIENIEWHLINTYFDETHSEVEVKQKSKFNVILRPDESIIVDSNAIKQEATLFTNQHEFNIARFQEPDFEFINFVRLSHGKNNLVFLTENLNLEIEIEFTLATELAY